MHRCHHFNTDYTGCPKDMVSVLVRPECLAAGVQKQPAAEPPGGGVRVRGSGRWTPHPHAHSLAVCPGVLPNHLLDARFMCGASLR